MRVRASIGELRKLADDMMSLYVRHAANWQCWVCGSTRFEEMQMAHLFGKGAYPNGRFQERNVRCVCKRCHRRYTDRPEEWRELLIERLGEADHQVLWILVRHRTGKKDYKLEILYWDAKICEDLDRWKIQERHDVLRKKGEELGVFIRNPDYRGRDSEGMVRGHEGPRNRAEGTGEADRPSPERSSGEG